MANVFRPGGLLCKEDQPPLWLVDGGPAGLLGQHPISPQFSAGESRGLLVFFTALSQPTVGVRTGVGTTHQTPSQTSALNWPQRGEARIMGAVSFACQCPGIC
jgi:hypothetical protein